MHEDLGQRLVEVRVVPGARTDVRESDFVVVAM